MGVPESPEPIVVRIDPDLADLVPRYLALRADDLVALREALPAGDWERIRRVGHSMRGTGMSYGFDRLTEIGGDLESAAKVEDAEAIRSQTEALADYLQRHPAMAGEGAESRFLTTGDAKRVSDRATQFLRRKIEFQAA